MEGRRLKDALIDSQSVERGEEVVLVDDVVANPIVASSSSLTATVVLCIAVVACGCFSYGCGAVYSSPAEFGIMGDLDLSISQYSVFGSMLTIGGMVGSLVSGMLSDAIGRKHTMWIMETFCIIGWIAIIFGKDALWLDIGRLFTGVGYGITLFVVPIYMAEITPKNIRGGCSAVVQLMICCGASLVYFIGNFINWRYLAVIGTVPCLLQVIGIFFIPESPRWLAKKGREKEVETALQRLRGENTDISLEADEIKEYTSHLQEASQSTFLDLFHWKYARAITVGAGLMLLVQFGGSGGITAYASSIFQRSGASVSIGTTAMAIIQIPCSALSVFLMDNCGRRPLLLVAGVGTAFGNLLVALGFLLQDLHQWKDLTAILTTVGILIYVSSMYIGLNAPWILMSEIFPINVKGVAGSFVTFISWSSSWIVSYAFNFLFLWSAAGIFFIFAVVCSSIVVFVAKLVPETKGRTLEEIHAEIILD